MTQVRGRRRWRGWWVSGVGGSASTPNRQRADFFLTHLGPRGRLRADRSPDQRDLAGGIGSRRERPHLDGVALSCHLLLDRGAVEKEIIEDEEVPGIENWADDAGVTGNTPDDLRADRPVEVGAAGTGLDDAFEAPGDDIEAWGIHTAARERKPEVDRGIPRPRKAPS